MPALNFNPQFADLVRTGQKCQTYRSPRKKPIKPGDTLHLFTGQRTPQCIKIGEGIVTSVEAVTLDEQGIRFSDSSWIPWRMNYEARQDGFGTGAQMRQWFEERYGFPWAGVRIQWRPCITGQLSK